MFQNSYIIKANISCKFDSSKRNAEDNEFEDERHRQYVLTREILYYVLRRNVGEIIFRIFEDLDFVEGYQNFGLLGGSNNLGKSILFFAACERYSQWKIPLEYYVSTAVIKFHNLRELIRS